MLQGNEIRIAVIDDDEDDKQLLDRTIKKMGPRYKVLQAENGEEGLKLLNRLKTDKSLPCLIVLDLNMPKMNGVEFLTAIRSNDHWKDLRVFVITTSDEILQELVNLSPRGIREHLGLSRPIYARTAVYGHFGRAGIIATVRIEQVRKPRSGAHQGRLQAQCVPQVRFGTREQIAQLRPLSAPVNTFQFGNQTITTLVQVMGEEASARAATDRGAAAAWSRVLVLSRCSSNFAFGRRPRDVLRPFPACRRVIGFPSTG
mgnify:CR=1 FL=1